MPVTGPETPEESNRAFLDHIFSWAHTVNTFAPDPVDPQIIRAVYDDIRWAPTQMNAQPLRLTLVTTSQAKQLLAPQLRKGNREKTLAAPLTLIAAWDPNWHEHLATLAPEKTGGKQRLAEDPTARHEIGQRSAFLQIGYLLLGLRAHGLVVGPMTGFNATGVDEAFHSETGWRTEMLINVGWAPNLADDTAVRPRAGRLSFDDACQIV